MSSPSLPTPAAESLAETLSFKSSTQIPRTVTYLPSSPPTPASTSAAKNPASVSTDPTRYVSWGPKTVFYATSPSTSKSSKGSSKSKSKSKKKQVEKHNEKVDEDEVEEAAAGGEMRFEKVVLNGSEEVQTTETTEVLSPEEGGGVKRTWV
ncbi:MAG: hypothetical protein Q9170_006590, partial [Blastenia crenularia]